MNTRPEISVVMSVFNGDAYLRGAVDSILLQENVDLEFIIVDDGSTDSTSTILEEYAQRDHRVCVVTQENAGLTRALIRGCAQARGRFIARQDADDRSLPGRLQKQADLLRRADEILFVSCWARATGPEDEVLLDVCPPADVATATRMLQAERKGPCAHGTVMMRRRAYESVGGYRWQFYYGQDSDLWLRLAENGTFAFVPDILYHYRCFPESISLGARSLQAKYGRLGQACKEARRSSKPEDAVLEEAARIRRGGAGKASQERVNGNYFIGSCLRRKRDPRAKKYLWRVVREQPLHFRAWYKLLT